MSSQRPSDLNYVPEESRYRYGCQTMEVLATSQPVEMCLFDYASTGETFPVAKNIFTTQNREFEEHFSTKIKGTVVQLLLHSSIPAECTWTLHVLRLGFQERPEDNPIVVHVCFARNYLSKMKACELVDEINAAISTANWHGENIHVDICQQSGLDVKLRSGTPQDGMDLSDNFSELYSFNPPCPGFSVGPKDNYLSAGSLTGFIKHKGVTYGLANSHVLNSPTEILGSGPYKHKDGETEFVVTIPASGDHDETKAEILDKRMAVQAKIQRVEEQKAGNLISTKQYDSFMQTELPRVEFWEKVEQDAGNYNIHIGNVVSTSGPDKSKKFYHGALDWGIFNTSFENIQNKHPRESIYDTGSGFKMFGRKDKSFIAEELGPAFIENSRVYFESGPEYKPLQEDRPKADDLYFKPASRTLGWRACKCNGIMATMKDNQDMVTDEYCFVGRGLGEPVSAKGDSGTPLLDTDFRPTAVLWGGDGNYAGFKDVTYATPLAVILRDVERRMGWEKGSVAYC